MKNKDLRELVKVVTASPESFWSNEFIYPLIHMLVESEAELIGKTDPLLGMTRRTRKKKAIEKLGLTGVWPVKEKG